MQMLSKLKSQIKRFWNFLGEDSLASWIANVVLSFILIYFIVYPGLGLILSTSLPVVAVVSGSMEHRDYSFNDWWENNWKDYDRYHIKKEDFSQFRFKNGFNKGDIMVIYGAEPKDIKVGQVIVYRSTQSSNPIIHRVVSVEEAGEDYYFTTKGDNNQAADQDRVGKEQIKDTGIAIIRIPYLGWIKIIFTEFISSLRR